LRIKCLKSTLPAVLTVLCLASAAAAQSIPTSLASLPEADAVIYISPQRIFNEAAPRVTDPVQVTRMREAFADLKKFVGIDPSSVEYLVIAVRFHKPANDLGFVAPDLLAVVSGDFSSDSLLTLGQLSLQDNIRVETHGSKSISLMKIDPIAAEAEKNSVLKPYAEAGVVPLNANTIAIGNLRYLKAAIDAADGNGSRISAATLESLLRDPNALIAASGSPLASFAKSFGLLGLESTSRDQRCDTKFGNFYAAVTMSGTSFSLRGAMHADNPDTAKIIHGLLSGLMHHGISAVPDKSAQMILQTLKMATRDSEIVIEADIPDKTVADFIKQLSAAPKKDEPATKSATKPTTRRPVRKKKPNR
jgi:hypothetical protein